MNQDEDSYDDTGPGPIVSLIGTTERGRKPKHLANLEADPLKDPVEPDWDSWTADARREWLRERNVKGIWHKNLIAKCSEVWNKLKRGIPLSANWPPEGVEKQPTSLTGASGFEQPPLSTTLPVIDFPTEQIPQAAPAQIMATPPVALTPTLDMLGTPIYSQAVASQLDLVGPLALMPAPPTPAGTGRAQQSPLAVAISPLLTAASAPSLTPEHLQSSSLTSPRAGLDSVALQTPATSIGEEWTPDPEFPDEPDWDVWPSERKRQFLKDRDVKGIWEKHLNRKCSELWRAERLAQKDPGAPLPAHLSGRRLSSRRHLAPVISSLDDDEIGGPRTGGPTALIAGSLGEGSSRPQPNSNPSHPHNTRHKPGSHVPDPDSIVILSPSNVKRLFEAARSGQLKQITQVLNAAFSHDGGYKLVPTDRQLVPSAFGGGSGFQFADEDEPSNIKKRKRQNEDIMDVGGVYAAKLAKHHEEALSLRNDEIRQLREELNQKNALIAELLFDNDKLRRETFKLQEDHDELKEQHSRLAESLQEFATTLAPATIAATAPLAVTQPLGSGPIEGYRDESRTED